MWVHDHPEKRDKEDLLGSKLMLLPTAKYLYQYYLMSGRVDISFWILMLIDHLNH